MGRKRKTIEVDYLKRKVNFFLLHSADEHVGKRAALATFLGDVLHETGNYNGFNYLTGPMMEESREGTTVGINVTREHGAEDLTYEERFKDTDESRRYYY